MDPSEIDSRTKEILERLENLNTFAENVELLLPTFQNKIVSIICLIEELEAELKQKVAPKPTLLSRIKSIFG